jgi:hypothetical protein
MARLLLARMVRWFPTHHFIFVGDMGYGTSETARFCRQRRRHLTLVSKFAGDAALYEPPPPRTRRTIGRPRIKGRKLASPQEVVANTIKRTRFTVAWYGGSIRAIEIVTGTGHWYRIGEALVAVRWVYVHDVTGTHRDEYLFSTCQPGDCETAWDGYPPRSDNRWGRPSSLQGGITVMTTFPRRLRHLQQLAGMLLALLVDALRYLGLCLRPPATLAAENLFLRKQLALYQERHIKPKRATHATRIALIWLARWLCHLMVCQHARWGCLLGLPRRSV